ncbi:MAG: Flp pilus assembly complex ATPase component TadA [Clostridia bacterium]|nr:Flp pilus assembly complex ATPase component TadA [Clostridia bacterium]
MLYDLLPSLICKALQSYDQTKLTEIRIRRNCPIVINYQGKNILLKTADGENIYSDKEIIEFILRKATENSLYAFNNQVKQGFITARGGIRIGIAGESVNSDNFMPKTIKDICSLSIRIPHEIVGCSNLIFKFICNEQIIKNTLIVSPPGAGKTTLLRDIARNFSHLSGTIFNVLIVDERFEIASCENGQPMLDVGVFTDVVSGASKDYAFTNAIRSLRPDVIITDELADENDVNACLKAVASGVKVIASVHANNLSELRSKTEFERLLNSKMFSRIVFLSFKIGPGYCQSIFDENMKCIYF